MELHTCQRPRKDICRKDTYFHFAASGRQHLRYQTNERQLHARRHLRLQYTEIFQPSCALEQILNQCFFLKNEKFLKGEGRPISKTLVWLQRRQACSAKHPICFEKCPILFEKNPLWLRNGIFASVLTFLDHIFVIPGRLPYLDCLISFSPLSPILFAFFSFQQWQETRQAEGTRIPFNVKFPSKFGRFFAQPFWLSKGTNPGKTSNILVLRSSHSINEHWPPNYAGLMLSHTSGTIP